MMSDLTSLTVPQLKSQLAEAGLPRYYSLGILVIIGFFFFPLRSGKKVITRLLEAQGGESSVAGNDMKKNLQGDYFQKILCQILYDQI